MPSDNALSKILGTKTRRQRLEDLYLFRPLTFDASLSVLIGGGYLLLDFLLPPIFGFDFDGLKDILNELISSSFAAGGIILAALGIIAAIKMTVPKKDPAQAETGKELLYNHESFNDVTVVFVKSCLTYAVIFVLVTFTRGLSTESLYDYSLAIMVLSLFAMCSAFLRCVWILWKVLKVG